MKYGAWSRRRGQQPTESSDVSPMCALVLAMERTLAAGYFVCSHRERSRRDPHPRQNQRHGRQHPPMAPQPMRHQPIEQDHAGQCHCRADHTGSGPYKAGSDRSSGHRKAHQPPLAPAKSGLCISGRAPVSPSECRPKSGIRAALRSRPAVTRRARRSDRSAGHRPPAEPPPRGPFRGRKTAGGTGTRPVSRPVPVVDG